MRYSRRRRTRWDKSQSVMMKELELRGYSVHSTADVGEGFPDLVVGKYGLTKIVEVKRLDETKNPKPTKLRESQVRFRREWRGDPLLVAVTAEEVVAWFERHKPLR